MSGAPQPMLMDVESVDELMEKNEKSLLALQSLVDENRQIVVDLFKNQDNRTVALSNSTK